MGLGIEEGRDVAVTEPGDGVLAGEHGPELGQVVGADRVEAGDGALNAGTMV